MLTLQNLRWSGKQLLSAILQILQHNLRSGWTRAFGPRNSARYFGLGGGGWSQQNWRLSPLSWHLTRSLKLVPIFKTWQESLLSMQSSSWWTHDMQFYWLLSMRLKNSIFNWTYYRSLTISTSCPAALWYTATSFFDFLATGTNAPSISFLLASIVDEIEQ